MGTFASMLADRSHDPINLLDTRRSYYRIVDLLKRIVGIDPTNPLDAELMGECHAENTPDSATICVDGIWFYECDGVLTAESFSFDAAESRDTTVDSARDLIDFVRRYPPYGWHSPEDETVNEIHLGDDRWCLACYP